jgi:GNAT superfamily N-acetyltransferase
MQLLMKDLQSNGKDYYFILAVVDDQIIGTAGFGPSGEMIREMTNGALASVLEIGSLYVHPDYQGKGVGSGLIDAILEIFRNQKIEEFCLDTGFPTAQKVWIKKFGKPTTWLKDYWGKGSDHMIWHVRI